MKTVKQKGFVLQSFSKRRVKMEDKFKQQLVESGADVETTLKRLRSKDGGKIERPLFK